MHGTDVQVTISVPTLREGSDGPTVKRVQSMLNLVGGKDTLAVDGIFGPKTEAAVKEFQGDEHLAVDGIVGQQTWTALLTRFLSSSKEG